MPTKDHGNIPVPKKNINRQQENNLIVDKEVDEVILIETQKVSAINHEALEFLDSDYDANYLYQVDKMSIEDNRERLYWRKRVFECK